MCISVTWALNKQLSLKYLAIYLMMFAFIIDVMIYNINKHRHKQTINLLLFLFSLIVNDVVDGTLIKDKHLLGYGVVNVEQYIKNQNNTHNIFSPHCYAIEILGDFGVPGVILYGIYYLYLVISNIIIGIKEKSIPCIPSATGLITFSIASFGPSSITYVFSYWILIAVAVAVAISCIQIYKNKRSILLNLLS